MIDKGNNDKVGEYVADQLALPNRVCFIIETRERAVERASGARTYPYR